MTRPALTRGFLGAMVLSAVSAMGALLLAGERWAARRDAEARLAQRRHEWRALSGAVPRPDPDTAVAIEADLARVHAALAALQTEFQGQGSAAEELRRGPMPATRTDAFFDVAAHVEHVRDVAQRHEVMVSDDAARFGFSAYLHEAPEDDRIEAVFRQRHVLRFLLEQLLASRPRVLHAVQREPALTADEQEARTAAAGPGGGGRSPGSPGQPAGPDYFTIDPRASLRRHGFIDTLAFRLVFTGETAVLRSFLNRLADFSLPVVVSQVDVEPAPLDEAVERGTPRMPTVVAAKTAAPPAPSIVLHAMAGASGTPVAAPPAAWPGGEPRISPTSIVGKTLSRFTVTVEFVTLVAPAANPADAASLPR